MLDNLWSSDPLSLLSTKTGKQSNMPAPRHEDIHAGEDVHSSEDLVVAMVSFVELFEKAGYVAPVERLAGNIVCVMAFNGC